MAIMNFITGKERDRKALFRQAKPASRVIMYFFPCINIISILEKDVPVLKSDGKEVYRFQDVLENQGFVVSNESNKRVPKYILEMRKLDGSSPQQLFTSDKEMLFIGWSK
ncbi:MAG: hypothetical protein KatS3mg088_717 [Patescibacteria group bacterium]|nr:MAG: hypothetical protein KatS3mg088_717 [Patescibacteria group bacterium]